ncbi:tape measure protein [Blastococcus sp. TBT05-19]|uniref:tape measure protein n=1 Tax=Blastococcus sp. TBT05-19 TaxID=2250581 RepID=UPI001314891C|nr:tape measure protein [Blastococcus sp. TBT05-19]
MTTLLGEARVRIRPDTSGFGSAAERGISGTLSKLGKLAGAAFTAGLGAATAGAGLGLKVAAEMETARIGFETMLGSAQKADAFLRDLQKFAAKTPFEFPELQTAASSLISIGIDASKVIPIMTTLGNVTSGMGTGAEGVKRATVAIQQMNAAGRITAEDLNQLRDAGIPVFDLLAGATGKAKEELAAMAQNGELGRKELEQLMTALETGKGLERFNGLMEKQSQSLSGLFSTMKDTVQMNLASAMTPLIPSIKTAMAGAAVAMETGLSAISAKFQVIVDQTPNLMGALADQDAQGVAEVLDNILGNTGAHIDIIRTAADQLFPLWNDLVGTFGNLRDVAADLGPVLGVILGGGLKLAWEAIQLLAPVLRDVTGWLSDNEWAVYTLVGAYAALKLATSAHAASMAVAAAGGMAQWLKQTKLISAATKAWSAVQWVFNAAMSANPILKVVTLLGLLVGGLVLAWKHSETFRDVVTGALQKVGDFGKWLWEEALKPAWEGIKTGWDYLVKGISWAWENILKPAWDAVSAAASWLWENVLKPVFGFIGDRWSTLLSNIQWAWENVLQPVWDAVSSAASWLWESVLKPVFGFIGDAWDDLASGFGWVYDNLIRPVFDKFSSAVETVKSGFGTAVDWIKQTWESLKDALMGPVQWVIDFVWNDGLRKLWNTINDLWGGGDLAEFKLARGGVYAPANRQLSGRMEYATGGVLPGYTPGRDVHHFVSPTGGRLHLSGGEAVMRPEFTKAMGVHGVNTLNKLARTGGARAVAAALAKDQSHADGGIIDLPGWLSTALDWIPGSGGITDVIDAINGGGGFGGGILGEGLVGLARSVGTKLLDKAKALYDGLSLGGSGYRGAKTANGVNGLGPAAAAARAYVMQRWGLTNIGGFARRNIAGTGTPSDHALGKAIDVMIPNYRSPEGIRLGTEIAEYFRTNPGVFGTKYVIWRDRIANGGAGWKPYGHPGGGRSDTLQHRDHPHVSFFDQGGVLEPGLTPVMNATGKPEAVLTNREMQDYKALIASGGQSAPLVGEVHLHSHSGGWQEGMEALNFELRRLKRGGRS